MTHGSEEQDNVYILKFGMPAWLPDWGASPWQLQRWLVAVGKGFDLFPIALDPQTGTRGSGIRQDLLTILVSTDF